MATLAAVMAGRRDKPSVPLDLDAFRERGLSDSGVVDRCLRASAVDLADDVERARDRAQVERA